MAGDDVSELKEKLRGLVKMIVDDDDNSIETAYEAIATISLLTKKKTEFSSKHPPPLPIEVITEILLRLPVRSLLRFRCVCKQWNSIISDTHFSKLHLSTLNHPHLILYNQRAWPPSSISCSMKSLFNDLLTPDEGLTSKKFDLIVGTCNGLLCLFYEHFRQVCVWLWNPSTRLESRVSPSIDNCYLICYYGFGYDHVSGKYKMLLVYQADDNSGCVAKVYTFGDSCWRTIRNFDGFFIPHNASGSFVSGTLNWIKMVSPPKQSCALYSFDLAKETLGQFSLHDDHLNIPKLATLKNCLCVSDWKRAHFVLWMMKEYGVKESWTKLVTIPHVELLLVVGRGAYPNTEPLCLLDSGEVLFIKCMGTVVGIFLYNPKEGRLKYHNIQKNMDRYSDQHVYLESLVSPCF